MREPLAPVPLPEGLDIPVADWHQTPLRVQRVVRTLLKRLEALGERIEALRRDKGWNWKELARRSRLHTQSIYKIVHGERADPRLSVIVRLALAFGVGVDTLLGPLEVYATTQDTVDGVSPTAPNGSPRPTRRRKTTPRPESA
jgi:transcriptional regulator with XRE-family HTH domain